MTQAILNIGDTVPIGQAMVNMIISALVTDINNPNMFAISLQAFNNSAVLESDALQGPQGIPGQLTFALRWQNDNRLQPSQLPTNLTDLPNDVGKFWIFGVTDQNGNTVATTMYVWWGTALGFKLLPVGTPGPVGPSPNITPNIVLQVPGSALGPGGVDSWIGVTGPVSNPVYTYNIASPRGITGSTSPLASWPEIDFVTHVPQPGDQLVCSTSTVPNAPTGLTILPASTGGTLGAGIYFYVVTAYLSNGRETLASNEVTTNAISGSTNSVALSWNPIAGGGNAGFKVYRGTTIGGENTLVATVANPAATSYTDTGGVGTPGYPPVIGSGTPVPGRSIWHAVTPQPIYPGFYTIPESSFTPVFGINGPEVVIATFAVPPQTYPWKPLVLGQMQIFGVNISFSPFLVGVEIILAPQLDSNGNPVPNTGAQVAQGFGDDFGYVSVLPQPSNPGQPSTAIIPTNKIAYVPANHTSNPQTVNAGTLYCILANQGMAGIYDFNNANSGLAVWTIPVPAQ